VETRVSLFLPEQHFGPLVAAQVPPGPVAHNGGGGALGDVVLLGAHGAAQVATCRATGGNMRAK